MRSTLQPNPIKAFSAAITLLVLILAVRPGPADDIRIDPDTFGAIAYSPKTGKYGYAWNQTTRRAAERVAVAECKEDDAKLLTWVQFGWAVLVIAEDKAYGFDEVHGPGATDADAEEKAMKELRKRTDAKVKTIVIVCSGDVKPKVIEK